PVPAQRPRGRAAHQRADARTARADRGRGRRRSGARRPHGPAAHARGRVPVADGKRGGGIVRLFLHQLRYEQLLFWRSREAAFFVFIFPLLLFVLLSSVYTGRYLGRPASWSVLAGIIGYGAANTGFAGLALLLVARREMGFLKRIRSTPIPASVYLTAVLTSMVVVFVLQTIAVFILGKALKSTPFPHDPLSLLLVILLGSAAFAAMGLGITSLLR